VLDQAHSFLFTGSFPDLCHRSHRGENASLSKRKGA
jgi:hypothetical protein